MGTVTKEGVKNARASLYPRKTQNYQYIALFGDQLMEVVGLRDVGKGVKLVVWKCELQLTAQRLNSLTKSRQKSWEFSSLSFTSLFFSFALRFLFLKTHATSYSFCKGRSSLRFNMVSEIHTETSSLRTLNRNLNDIVRSWIRLQEERPVLYTSRILFDL